MNAIVSTTINPPTEAILKYLEKPWEVYIVGDLKTPETVYEDLQEKYPNLHYLNTAYQVYIYPELSEIIGWNSIQRRAIGFVEAYRAGAEIIASVDDDNIPYDFWGENLLLGKEIEVDCLHHEVAFDPLSVTSENHLWHRGYPLQLIKNKNHIDFLGTVKRTFMVQADLWDGDPDVDAIGRLTYHPEVKFLQERPYCADVPSPFNTQNTFFTREAIRQYYLFPGIGRMDDIWGAYDLQARFPGCVVYNRASVYQKRNPHDATKDIQAEMLGYMHSLEVIKNGVEDYLPQQAKDFRKAYAKLFS